MTAQKTFDDTYVTSTDIARRLCVSRSAVIQARQKGKLPDPIFIENHLVIWERATIEPYVATWERERKERIGVI